MKKLFFILLFFLFKFNFAQIDNFEGNYTETIRINDIELTIEIADTDHKRAIGLMYRKSMPDSCGMLFIFPQQEQLSFWMKDTYIPLSIAFINRLGIIVNIKEGKPLSLETILSEYPAKYALEVNYNWFEKNNIKIGDKIDF